MPGRERGDAPRTDLPPEREPYYEGYFGTGEEEGVVRERDAGEGSRDKNVPEKTRRTVTGRSRRRRERRRADE